MMVNSLAQTTPQPVYDTMINNLQPSLQTVVPDQTTTYIGTRSPCGLQPSLETPRLRPVGRGRGKLPVKNGNRPGTLNAQTQTGYETATMTTEQVTLPGQQISKLQSRVNVFLQAPKERPIFPGTNIPIGQRPTRQPVFKGGPIHIGRPFDDPFELDFNLQGTGTFYKNGFTVQAKIQHDQPTYDIEHIYDCHVSIRDEKLIIVGSNNDPVYGARNKNGCEQEIPVNGKTQANNKGMNAEWRIKGYTGPNRYSHVMMRLYYKADCQVIIIEGAYCTGMTAQSETIITDNFWSRNYYCEDGCQHNGNCPILSTTEHQSYVNGKPTKEYLAEVERIVRSIEVEINMAQIMDDGAHGDRNVLCHHKFQRMGMASRIQNYPMVISVRSNPQLLEHLPESLRNRIVEIDLRLKDLEKGLIPQPMMRAQDDTNDQDMGNEHGYMNGVTSFIQKIWSGNDNNGGIKSIFDKVWNGMTAWLESFSTWIQTIMQKIRLQILRLIVKALDPIGLGQKFIDNPNMCRNFVTIYLPIIMVITGFVSSAMVCWILNTLFKLKIDVNEIKEGMSGQSPPMSLAGILCALTIAVVGSVSGSTKKQIAEHCTFITKLAAGGLVMAGILSTLAVFLPSTITHALRTKCMSEKELISEEFNQWYTITQALTRISRIPTVITSDHYKEKLDELALKGRELAKKTEGGERVLVIKECLEIARILQTIVSYNETSSTRSLPFAFHLAGAPGVGKTTIAHAMMSEIFGYTQKKDIFMKSTDERFTGYIDQKVVIWDEFLSTGDTNYRIKSIEAYLQLVSTAAFKPDMASLDNPTVGIKGTVIRPEVVVTISNEKYTGYNFVNKDALEGRRQFVVELIPTAKAKTLMKNNRNFDLMKYSEKERENFAWLQFRVYSGTQTQNANPPAIDYPTLCKMIRKSHKDHLELAEAMTAISRGKTFESRTAQEIIDEAIMDTTPLQKEPMGVMEAITTFLFGEDKATTATSSGSMTAQGKSKKNRRHTATTATLERQREEAMRLLDGMPTSATPAYVGKYGPLDSDSDTELNVTATENDDATSYTSAENEVVGMKDYVFQSNCLGHTTPMDGKLISIARAADLSDRPELIPTENDDGELRAVYHPVNQDFIDSEFLYTNFDGSYDQKPGEPDGQYRARLIASLATASHGYCLALSKAYYDWFDYYADDQPTTRVLLKNATDNIRSNGIEITKSVALGSLRLGAFAFVLYAACKGLYGMMFGSKISKVSITGQSDRPDNEEAHMVKRPTYSKGMRNMRSQAPNEENTLTWISPNGESRTATFIPLKGDMVLTFGHLFLYQDDYGNTKTIEDGETITFNYDGISYPTKYDSENTVTSSADWMIIKHGIRQMPAFKNKISSFITDNQLIKLSKAQVRIDGLKGTYTGQGHLRKNMSYSAHGRNIVLDRAFHGAIPTLHGDCGAPWKLINTLAAGKIIGIHVAGTGPNVSEVQGMATVITQEDIKEAIDVLTGSMTAQSEVKRLSEVDDETMDKLNNCEYIGCVPMDERIYIPRVTKYTPSAIADYLPENDSHPPILNRMDERNEDSEDPALIAVLDTCSKETVPVDEALVEAIAETVAENHKRNMTWPVENRELTFEEACVGIPGILAAPKIRTSPGLPLALVRKQIGKRDFLRFDAEGNMSYCPIFRKQVEQILEDMKNGEEPDHIFLGYLKDEVLPLRKIKPIRTRTIYCADFIANMAFRMKFGSFLAAYNNSNGTIPSAIGMNQYSYDMQQIYDYLTNDIDARFIAGDYKSFDKHYHGVFQKATYKVIKEIIGDRITDNEWNYFVKHQTDSPAQIDYIRFKTRQNHMSGCFFTTIANNIQNELYHRYCFAREHPDIVFDEVARIKVLGDDHILAIDESVSYPGPVIQKRMTEIGQIYTSDKKDLDIEDYQSIEDISFLGANFRLLYGRFTGVMKESTLIKSLRWTKDHNESLPQTVKQLLECTSQGPRKWHEYWKKLLYDACEKEDIEILDLPPYGELSRIVASRTAGSRATFVSAMIAQGETGLLLGSNNGTGTPEHVQGLTTFHTEGEVTMNNKIVDLSSNAINETAMGIEYGTNTEMYRADVAWKSTDAVGTVLWSAAAPYGLLKLGTPHNIQNMPFERFIYWRGDVKITLQINGTMFQQGMLVAYWYPLSNSTDLEYTNWTSQPHIKLSPVTNTTRSLEISYQFPTSAMNNFEGIDMSDPRARLGTFVLGVLSPLKVATGTSSVIITIYSQFPNSKFTMPRQIPTTKEEMAEPEPLQLGNRQRIDRPKYFRGFGNLGTDADFDTEYDCEAQGQAGSTINNNKTINITGTTVAGNLPVDAGASTASGNKQDISPNIKADVSAIPMDNTPLCSGAVPVVMQYSGLSKANGVEPTMNMALHPSRMDRYHQLVFDRADSDMKTWLEKPCLLTSFSWKTGDVAGTSLLTLPLNTALGMQSGDVCPANLAVLNTCLFWRADFEFEFVAVKSGFHSGRLLFTSGYGKPSAVTADERSVYYSHPMDFTPDKDRATVLVKYNAMTRFLRTYEGENVIDPVEDYSLGFATVFVQNQLIGNASIADEVEVLVFVRVMNATIAVPRPEYFWTVKSSFYGSQSSVTTSSMVAQGEETSLQQTTDDTAAHAVESNTALEEPGNDGVPVTDHQSTEPTKEICRIQPGEKFEYPVTNMHEIMRRAKQIIAQPVTGSDLTQDYTKTGQVLSTKASAYITASVPWDLLTVFYAARGGGLKYRIYNGTDTLNSNSVMVLPIGIKPNVDIKNMFIDQLVGPQFSSNHGTFTVQTDGYTGFNKPQEMLFTTGQSQFIDIHVPFDSHFDYLEVSQDPTGNGQTVFQDSDSRTGMFTSWIVITNYGNAGGDSHPIIFQSVGDDYMVGVPRTPLGLKWEPPVVPTTTRPAMLVSGFAYAAVSSTD